MRDSTTRFVFALSGGFCMGILFSRQPPRAASAPIALLEHHCTVERPSVFQACTLRNSIGAGVSCSSVYSSHGFSWAPPLPTFRQKGDLPRILQAEGHRVGVEVGVLDGRFAEWMLKTWRSCESYSLVDPWVAHDDTYRDASAQRTQDAAAFMAAATDRMKPFGARARILRNTSVAAAATFADASVDFVFIDARHTYDAVSEDLRAWWPKIRPGGILAGHDYVDSDELWRFSTCQWGWPWKGCAEYKCVQWDKACDTLPETKRQGSAAAVSHKCGQDWAVQADGSRRSDHKAVRSAVDEFAASVGRQVAVAYRDAQQAFFFETWAIRR